MQTGMNDVVQGKPCQWMLWIKPSENVPVGQGGYMNSPSETLAEELLCVESNGSIYVARSK